ncbi:EF-hand domain-containing protein [Candidatus Nitrosacidococcus tergens]|uniref:EF-hand domain-containing protein n=1 Tax=Candidatus Nitrosacidococcus tergens TaxID=553981 RepID=A0A7G1Q7D0_9GAMM|nr:EF-hand domain-containing protein [Candidatus Nitrosacidococcus tergens]CAB1274188.1 exported protein of unknown function [Candidatus Nitrosacidococcus tergens]
MKKRNLKNACCLTIFSGILAISVSFSVFAGDRPSSDSSYKYKVREETQGEKLYRELDINKEQLFKELDINKDGKISQLEIDLAANKRFKNIDLNGDGYLSEEELYIAQLNQEANYTKVAQSRLITPDSTYQILISMLAEN